MTKITAKEAAEKLAETVILNFANEQALEGNVAHISNTTIRLWNDILDALRSHTKSCGGGLLALHELQVVSQGDIHPMGVALFFIKKGEDEAFLGATWNDAARVCSIYGHEDEFPQVLKGLVDHQRGLF